MDFISGVRLFFFFSAAVGWPVTTYASLPDNTLAGQTVKFVNYYNVATLILSNIKKTHIKHKNFEGI